MFIPLKPLGRARGRARGLGGARHRRRKARALREGMVIAFNPAAIRGLGTSGGFEMYLQARTDADPQRLFQVTQAFARGAAPASRAHRRELVLPSDRAAAARRGRPREGAVAGRAGAGRVRGAAEHHGRRCTSTTSTSSAAPTACRCRPMRRYRAQPEDLGAVFVRSAATREMIPLKSLIQHHQRGRPRAARALQRLRRRARARQRQAGRVLRRGDPRGRGGRRERAARGLRRSPGPGQAFQEKRTGRQSAIAFGLAIVMVFLILAALYERWLLPFAVVLAVPFAVLGALAFVCDARPRERHLLPDRPGGADRPGGEERDPDRRIRAAGLPRGQGRGRRRRSTPRACASGRSS